MSAKRFIQIIGKPTLGRGDLSLTVKFKREALQITESPFGVILNLEACHLGGEPGSPGFPRQLLRLALPPYSDITAVQVTVTKKAKVTKEPVFIAPVQEPRPGGPAARGKQAIKRSLFGPQRAEIAQPTYVQKARGVTLPHLDKYRRVLAEPAPVAQITAIEHRGSATVLTLEMNPVSQNKDGVIELATEIKINLAYEATSAPKVGGPFVGSRDFKRARNRAEAKRFADILRAEVINPDWVVDMSDLLPNISGEYDYLVITDDHQWDPVTITPTDPVDGLVASFQKLVDWKKRRGLRARVITISNIVNGVYGDFMVGACDLQEVIRNFLKWAYANWEISWVLLGGDTSVVPVRIVAGGCRGHILVKTTNPPNDDKSYWTGSYLKMHVVGPGESWPGDWPLILVNPATGEKIPHDPTGVSALAGSICWYYTDAGYTTFSGTPTEFVVVNGPESLLKANLQWLYRWNRVPTDLYYSSLVGPHYNVQGHHDWNLNNNGLYGQDTDSLNIDGVNYAADIGLGRAPVASEVEADAFVNKVIAYEQFRRPDGTALNLNWPRRLLMVASNWGGVAKILPTTTTPPGNKRYYHDPADPYTLIKLKETFEEIDWRLFVIVSETDIRSMPYDPEAADLGRGWYFAQSGTDLSVSEVVLLVFGGWMFRYPIPTKWVVVYGDPAELAPLYYLFNREEADDSMSDQETLRKQLATDFPGINTVKRLYMDEVDLPPADATSPPVDYLTADRLRAKLNLGQHFVSLSGHGGAENGCCTLDGTMAEALTNGYHTFIAYADSCLTGNFEWEDAMSEKLVKNPNGGAVAYVGNTRFSWIGNGDEYQRKFFERLKSVRHLALLNDSRFDLINDGATSRWIKFSLHLLGDPEMPVWVGKPQTLTVTHPATIYKADTHVLVQVTSSGGAVAEAVVCFAMGNWAASAVTNSTGQADIHVALPATGSLEIVVTARDCVPYLGTLTVKEGLCKTKIHSGVGIACQASVQIDTPRTCGALRAPGRTIVCGGKIACNLAISGSQVGIAGCPAVESVPSHDFIDILKECGVRDVKELATKKNTARVKKVLAKLKPANRKAFTLMLKRIGKE